MPNAIKGSHLLRFGGHGYHALHMLSDEAARLRLNCLVDSVDRLVLNRHWAPGTEYPALRLGARTVFDQLQHIVGPPNGIDHVGALIDGQ